MTPTARLNLHWGQTTAEALFLLGLRHLCISPGSRNTPLTLSFTRHGRFKLYSVIDERSAAYFALGLAKYLGEPVGLLCTSGTAAANYYPAVIEANLGRVPLIFLTADRPASRVGKGSNQTINQQNLYGRQVRWFRDVGLPKADKSGLIQHLKSAVMMSLGQDSAGRKLNPRGPVQLNFPFDEPLLPTDLALIELEKPVVIDPEWDLDLNPVAYNETEANSLPDAKRPLIIAGELPAGTDRASILKLAGKLSAPIFADPASQLRFGFADGNVLSSYDLFLPEVVLEPDLVLRLGKKPTSKILCQLLDQWQDKTILIDPRGRFNDDCATVVQMEIGQYCTQQKTQLKDDNHGDWNKKIKDYDHTASELAEQELKANPGCEGYVVKSVLETMAGNANLILGNSMPIRYADRFGRPSRRSLRVFTNRGASGIDGVVSAALGIAAASGHRENLLIIGDLSFYHDLNSLLLANRYDISLTIVLLNNNGGGIFSILPIRDLELPEFREFWTTPHALDFSDAARMYGCIHKSVQDITSLQQLIGESFTLPGIKILEFQTDPENDRSLMQRLQEKIRKMLNPHP